MYASADSQNTNSYEKGKLHGAVAGSLTDDEPRLARLASGVVRDIDPTRAIPVSWRGACWGHM